MKGYSKLWSILVPIFFLLSLAGTMFDEPGFSFFGFSPTPSEMGGSGWTIVSIDSLFSSAENETSSNESETIPPPEPSPGEVPDYPGMPGVVPIEDLIDGDAAPPQTGARSACDRMGLDSAYCVDKEERIMVANLRNTEVSLGKVSINKSESFFDEGRREYRVVNTRLFLKNLTNVLFKDTEFVADHGSAYFPSLRLTVDSETDLSKVIVIQRNHVGIDSSSYPQFDAPATLTLTNLYGLKNPYPLRNGEPCKDYCSNFAYNPSTGVVSMDVSGFSNYSIGEINITYAEHLDSTYGFISDITDDVYYKDDVWSEPIPVGHFVRATFEQNLTNGRIIDVFARKGGASNVFFNIYVANTTSPLVGTSGPIDAVGSWHYINVSGLSQPEDTFDFEILGDSGGYAEFDFIHDIDVGGCQIISSPGTYSLTTNLVGANITGTVGEVGGSCILISSNDVHLDCDGYSITNDGTTDRAGILVNGSASTPRTNITIKNCPMITGYEKGVYLYYATQSSILNTTAANNNLGSNRYGFFLHYSNHTNIEECTSTSNPDDGFLLVQSNHNSISNCTSSGSSAGFYLFTSSTYNNLTGNNAFNNTIGIYIDPSYNNTIIANNAYNNSQYGLALDDSHNNTLENNTAYTNSLSGFYINRSTNNLFINNTAYFNYVDGFEFRQSNYTNITDSFAYNNTETGFAIKEGSEYNRIEHSIATNNTHRGFRIDNNCNHNVLNNNTAYTNLEDGFVIRAASTNNTISNSLAYSNTWNGFSVEGTTTSDNLLYENIAHSNLQDGFILGGSSGLSLLENNTAYLHTTTDRAGISIRGSSLLNTLKNNTVHSNYFGLFLSEPGTSNVLNNTVIYNNTVGALAYKTIGGAVAYQLWNATFLPSSGLYENYSVLDIGDSLTAGEVYSFNWSGMPSAPPLNRFSFSQKFLDIANYSAGVAISNISWKWSDSEITGEYDEDYFELWKYNASAGWTMLNDTPDTTENTLTLYDMNPASGYGILQKEAIGCQVISSPGSYGLDTNATGAPHAISNILGYQACVIISSSNVVFDCNGYAISNNGTADALGIAINGTSGGELSNIAIRNCPGIDGYLAGVFAQYMLDSELTNSTLHENTYGFYMHDSSSHNNITYSRVYNNSERGISISGQSTQNRIYRTNVSENNIDGIWINESSGNILEEVNSYDNLRSGVHILDSLSTSINPTLIYNSKLAGNAYSGAQIAGSNHTYFRGVEILHNQREGILASGTENLRYLPSDNTSFVSRIAYNTREGIYLYNSTFVAIDPTEPISGNPYEIHIHENGMHGIRFSVTNHSRVGPALGGTPYIFIYNNSENGISLSTSYYNNITAVSSQNNSWSGINLASASNFNIISDSVSAFNEREGIHLLYTQGNLLEGNTLANNTWNGLYIYGRPLSSANEITGGVFANNSLSGLNASDSGLFNVRGAEFSGNSLHGAYIEGSDNFDLRPSGTEMLVAKDNIDSGIYIHNSTSFTLSTLVAGTHYPIRIHNNGVTGITLSNSTYGTVGHDSSSAEDYFHIYDNAKIGIYVTSPTVELAYHGLYYLNVSRNADYGIYLKNSRQANITECWIYNHTSGKGVVTYDSSHTRINQSIFYNNELSLEVINTLATTLRFYMFSSIFGNNLGTPENYTKLSIEDTLSASSSYTINWTNQPATPLPDERFSFRGKFLDISRTSGTVSIASIAWEWENSEVTYPPYKENFFELWKHNSSNEWELLNDTPDTSANTLTLYGMNPESEYGILQFNGSECMEITEQGVYTIINDLEGAPILMSQQLDTVSRACIVISSPNVTFNCSGYKITGEPLTGAAGIVVNGSDASPLNNITITDCPGISQYMAAGVFVYNSTQVSISHVAAANNNVNLYLYNTTYSNITSSNASDSTGTTGIKVYLGSNNRVTGLSRIFNNPIGINLTNSDHFLLNIPIFYGNGQAIIVSNSPASLPMNFTLNNGMFYDSFSLNYHSRLSISDMVEPFSQYSIDWAPTPSTPTYFFSFRNKTANITTIAGSVSIDRLATIWDGSESIGYNESQFQLWRHSSSGWAQLNITPDTASNYIEIYDVDPQSEYAILYSDLTSCFMADTPNVEYTFSNGFTGAPYDAPPTIGKACIVIAAQNVTVDCNGYTLTNDGSLNAFGIFANSSVSNFTVKNCGKVSGYSTGALMFLSSRGTIQNSTFQGNTYGIWAQESHNNTIENTSISDSTMCIYTEVSNDTTVANSTIFSCSTYGTYILRSSMSMQNNLFFNSTSDIYVSNTGASKYINMTGCLFLPPSGLLQNYTNLSLYDVIETETYSLKWTQNSTEIPSGATSFENKYIAIDNHTSSVSISQVTWHWDDSELPGYNETSFFLWKSTPTTWAPVLGAVLDPANNRIYANNLNPESDYGIFESAFYKHECFTADVPGATYELTNNLEGAPLDFQGIAKACIIINVSDVTIDCKGYNVTNNGTAGSTYGIVTNTLKNATVGQHLDNVQVVNCDASGYSAGISFQGFYYVSGSINIQTFIRNSLIQNSSGFNNTHHGVHFYRVMDSIVNESSFYDNGESGANWGESIRNTFDNSTLYNNTDNGARLNIGVYAISHNNTYQNMQIHNNKNGIYLFYVGDTNIFYSNFENHTVASLRLEYSSYGEARNLTFNNSTGFHIYLKNSTWNQFFNTSAYDASYGIYLDEGSTFNSFNTNVVRDTNYGIYLAADTNVFSNTNVSDYTYGITLNDASNNNFADTITENGTAHGIFLQPGSRYNSFTDTISTNNTVHGIHLEGMRGGAAPLQTEFNTFIRGDVYNNSVNGIYTYQAERNNFRELRAYENTERGYLSVQSDANTIRRSNFTDNGLVGIHLNDSSSYNMIYNTSSKDSVAGISVFNSDYTLMEGITTSSTTYGINLLNADYTNITAVEISQSSDIGIWVYSSLNLTTIDAYITDYKYGFYLQDSSHNAYLINSTIRQGSETGIMVIQSNQSGFGNVTTIENDKNGVGISHSTSAYFTGLYSYRNGKHGLWAVESEDVQIAHSTFYLNGEYGTHMQDTGSSWANQTIIYDSYFYANPYANVFNNTYKRTFMTLLDCYYSNYSKPSLLDLGYTKLYLKDEFIESPAAFYINWTRAPTALDPPQHFYMSFRGKMVEISNLTGGPFTVDEAAFYWHDSEVTGEYDEDKFELAVYPVGGSFLLGIINSTPDTVNNHLSNSSMFVGKMPVNGMPTRYGIFQNNGSRCMIITEPGTHTFNQDIYGAPIPVSGIDYGLVRACIVINSDNVELDCANYSIRNEGGSAVNNAVGILVNGTIPAPHSNITVKNCEVYNYSVGTYSYNQEGGIYDLMLVHHSSAIGMILRQSQNINLSHGQISNTATYYGLEIRASNKTRIEHSDIVSNAIGIQFSYSELNTLYNNTIQYNTEHGVRMDTSPKNTFVSNRIFNNGASHSGIYIGGKSDSNNLSSNEIWNNGIGAYVYDSVGSFFTYNNIFENSDGLRIEDSDATMNPNIFIGDRYYNNSGAGINVSSSAYAFFDKILVEDNTMGARFYDSTRPIIFSHSPGFTAYSGPDTAIRNNSRYGVLMQETTQGEMLAYGTHTLNLTGNGFGGFGLQSALVLYDSEDCIIKGNDAESSVNIYDNYYAALVFSTSPMETNHLFSRVNIFGHAGYGLSIIDSDKVNVADSNFFGQTGLLGTGIYMESADNCIFERITAYANSFAGLAITDNSLYLEISDSAFFDNPGYGLWAGTSNVNATDSLFYNNTDSDIYFQSAGPLVPEVSLNNVSFLNPSGTFENYSRISFSDWIGVGEAYILNWTQNSSPLPENPDYVSFRQKYVEVTTRSGSPILSMLRFHWHEDEVDGYVEKNLRLFKYNTTNGWMLLNNTPDTSANTLSWYSFNPASDYGILQLNGSECMVITEEGEHQLINNITGAPIPISPEPADADWACIVVSANNVVFDCNGYYIINDGTSDAAGVYINGTAAINRTNVTIQNCPSISSYKTGAYQHRSSVDTWINLTVENSSANGFRAYNSQDSSFLNNTARNNSISGFSLLSTQNFTLMHNKAYNNSHHGASILAQPPAGRENYFASEEYYNNTRNGFNAFSSTNFHAIGLHLHENKMHGAYLENCGDAYLGTYPVFTPFISEYNQKSGIYLNNSVDILIIVEYLSGPSVLLRHNLEDGLFLYNSVNCSVGSMDSANLLEIYNNTRSGVYFYSPGPVNANNLFVNIESYSNHHSGFNLSHSGYTNITSCSIHGNYIDGAYISMSQNTNFSSNEIFNNTRYGMFFADGSVDGTKNHFFNNSEQDLRFAQGGGPGATTIHFTELYIDNPYGNYTNYTNLSITDVLEPDFIESYTINWTAVDRPLPGEPPYITSAPRFSFREKWVNISIYAGTPIIDTVVWNWADPEVTGYYNESLFELWKYNSSAGWTLLNNSPDASANTLSWHNFNPASDYGILQFNGSECMEITTEGEYQLINNIEGAPIAISPAPGDANWACIVVSASNVIFDCNGFNITNDGTIGAAGIYINGTAALNRTNVTIQNCALVSSYAIGTYQHYSTNDTFQTIIVENSSSSGFHIHQSTDSLFRNNIVRNTSGTGIRVAYSSNCTLSNNLVHNNTQNGILFLESDYTKVLNSRFYFNGENGIELRGSSHNEFTDNLAYNNTQSGAYSQPEGAVNSHNNTFTGGRFYNNANHGILLSSSFNSTFHNLLIYSNAQNGIHLTGVSGNSNHRFTSVSSYGNLGRGFYSEGQHLNTINNSLFYDNQGEGLFFFSSDHNKVENNDFYNNTDGAYFRSSVNNSFLNNSAYNNTMNGLYILTSQASDPTANVFEQDRYYNNTQSGFSALDSTYFRLYGIYAQENGEHGVYAENAENFYIFSSSDSQFISEYNAFSGIYIKDSDDFLIAKPNMAVFQDFYSRHNGNHGLVLQNSTRGQIYAGDAGIDWIHFYNNTQSGIYITGLAGNTNHRIVSVRSHGNTQKGLFSEGQHLNTINNSLFYDNQGEGLFFFSSNHNKVENNEFYNNTDGAYLRSSVNNTFLENSAYNNTMNGLYILTSQATSATLNTFISDQYYNNTMSGANITGSDHFSFLGSDFLENGIDGAYAYDSRNFTFYTHTGDNTYAELNSRSGLYIENSDTFTISPLDPDTGMPFELHAANNSMDGITVYNSSKGTFGYTVPGLYAYSNSRNGININNPAPLAGLARNHRLMNIQAYLNSYSGFNITYSRYTLVDSCKMYGNSLDGASITSSQESNFTNNEVYNNTNYGLSIFAADEFNATNNHFFNNSQQDLLLYTPGVLFNVYFQELYIDNPYGNYENYTNLSITDSVDSVTGYTINWTAVTRPLPGFAPYSSFPQHFSFREKWVNISAYSGVTSIDTVIWNWADSEVTGDYNESLFELWKFNSSAGWTLLNDTPDIGANTLSWYNFNPASDYGILQFNGSECMEINESGEYYLENNIFGAPIPISPDPGDANRACIVISASDVLFDCAGYNITNDGTVGAAAIYINGTMGTGRENITIQNCPSIYNYNASGIYAHYSEEGTIQNNTVHRETSPLFFGSGINVYYSDRLNITNNTVSEFEYGIFTYESDYLQVKGNYVNRTESAGIYLRSDYSNVENNTLEYCGYEGVYLIFSSNNTVHNNYVHVSVNAFSFISSYDANITNNTASYGGDAGFYFGTSYGLRIDDNVAFSAGDGFYFAPGATLSTASNNTAYDNSYGFHLDGADSIVLSNNTAYENYNNGFYIGAGATFNLIHDCISYNNTAHGFVVHGAATQNNTLENNTAYLHNDTINNRAGLFIMLAVNNTFRNNTLHSNNAGALVLTAEGTYLDTTILHNNTVDFVVAEVAGVGFNMYSWNTTFLPDSGVYENFSVIDIEDWVEPGDMYYLDWIANTHGMPTPLHFSFREKFVLIEHHPLSPVQTSIDKITWKWDDSEVTYPPYDEAFFELWKYNSSSGWSLLNNTPDTTANTLTQYNMNPESTYGILQGNNCPIINESGSYELTFNMVGAPNVVNAYEVTRACLIIEASDVDFDCNGYNITNNGTLDAVGAIVNGSLSADYINVTLRNCPQITEYEKGAYMHLSSDNLFTNITAFNNTDAGIFLYGQSDSALENLTSSNNSIGFRVVNSNNTHINDTFSFNNTNYGVRNINSNYTNTENLNITYNGINGFYLDSESEYNSMETNYVCFNGLDISNSSAYTTGTEDVCDTFIGWSEDGHPGCTYRCTEIWHLFYGNVTGELVLAEEGMEVFQLDWSAVGYNLYAVNTDSSPSIIWSSLLALGRNTSIQPSTDDFTELDTLLGTSAYPDSVTVLYSPDGSTPYLTLNRNIYKVPVHYVPITNSTNSSTFVTGILWDSSQSTTGQFGPVDNEDVVFVSPASPGTTGTYGTYDYEMIVPAPLATYKGASQTVDIYVELI